MNPVLRNYTNAVNQRKFYTEPKTLGHISDIKLYTKVLLWKLVWV